MSIDRTTLCSLCWSVAIHGVVIQGSPFFPSSNWRQRHPFGDGCKPEKIVMATLPQPDPIVSGFDCWWASADKTVVIPSDYTCRSYPILPVKKDQVFHPDFCLSSTKRTPNNGSFRIQKKSNPVFGFYVSLSSDPESHPKVGFESVSGFGFRVSSIETNFRFRVSGFGFRRLKPTFAVGFGFRVSSIETNFRCRFRVSGFGFRRLKPTFAVGFGFRVSGFVDWNQLSLSVSGFGFRRLKPTFAVGFGFRVSSLETNFRCRFRVSGFGFRGSKPTLTVGFGFRVSIGPGEGKSSETVLGKVSLQSRFRVSGFDRSWGS